MAEDAVGAGARYWAFISYSHRDAAFGRRLHRRLENYAMPRRLAGRATARGTVPARLSPIFRDRDELAAAHDLSAEVRAALAASRSLIVVCSPDAAASPWVSREIEAFRELHPDRPILAAIAKGEPSEAFPAALRLAGTGGVQIEPLAADFREKGDGERAALLKLVAGIAGIGLDELVQRDAQRNIRRVTAVTAGALAGMLVMGLLTIFAFTARQEAERQRSEAEGLVRFMSRDLRERVETIGRLDIMTVVNQNALDYFDRNAGRLSPDSRANRALVLDYMGIDEDAKGHSAAAGRMISEAYGITEALLASDPENPAWIYDHAQSESYSGIHAYSDSDWSDAARYFENYRRLAQALVTRAPSDWRYLRELGFAEGLLCTLEIKRHGDATRAVRLCRASLDHMTEAAGKRGVTSIVYTDIVNRESWMATALRYAKDDREAAAYLKREQAHILPLLTAEPLNMMLRRDWVASQRVLAYIEADAGEFDDALDRLRDAQKHINDMTAFDPENKDWASLKTKVDREISQLEARRKARAP